MNEAIESAVSDLMCASNIMGGLGLALGDLAEKVVRGISPEKLKERIEFFSGRFVHFAKEAEDAATRLSDAYKSGRIDSARP